MKMLEIEGAIRICCSLIFIYNCLQSEKNSLEYGGWNEERKL